jgi:hypothetical protein
VQVAVQVAYQIHLAVKVEFVVQPKAQEQAVVVQVEHLEVLLAKQLQMAVVVVDMAHLLVKHQVQVALALNQLVVVAVVVLLMLTQVLLVQVVQVVQVIASSIHGKEIK